MRDLSRSHGGRSQEQEGRKQEGGKSQEGRISWDSIVTDMPSAPGRTLLQAESELVTRRDRSLLPYRD